MQAIEAAVHRWDAENALGAAGPLDAALAVDAIGQTLEFLVPMRRAMAQAPPGEGERFAFRRATRPCSSATSSWSRRYRGAAEREECRRGRLPARTVRYPWLISPLRRGTLAWWVACASASTSWPRWRNCWNAAAGC